MSDDLYDFAWQELECGDGRVSEARGRGFASSLRRPLGTPGHQRQRYKGVPANGDPPHRFTQLLPREESWTGACEACVRSVRVHEGPHAARNYQFVARGIAGALKAVGAGSSYRGADKERGSDDQGPCR